MAPISEYPTFDEWMVTLQTNPELAGRHVQHLRRQASMYGLSAAPELLLCIEDYERARSQLATMPARHIPEAASAATIAAPQSALAAYPDVERWQALIAADAHAAWRQLADLQLQAARLGILNTPTILRASIEAYTTAKNSLAAAQPQQPQQPEQSPVAEGALLPAQKGVSPESTLYPYPDLRDWQALIATDASAAMRQLGTLKLQAAQLGEFNTPFALHASIEAYTAAQNSLAAAQSQQPDQPPAAEAATPDVQPIEPTSENQPWWKRLLDR